MYYCTAVGVDDAPRQRVLPIDELNRERAFAEIIKVTALFDAFSNGRAEATQWTVPPAAIADRMDVKACLTQAGRRVAEWHEAGLNVVTLDELIEPIEYSDEEPDRYIDAENVEEDEMVTYLRVRYDGFTESGDSVWISEVGARYLVRVKTGDIVFSHINALHGAVGVVPS
jgi:type I restriction enzyme M protein